jgi:hypothetical protein
LNKRHCDETQQDPKHFPWFCLGAVGFKLSEI